MAHMLKPFGMLLLCAAITSGCARSGQCLDNNTPQFFNIASADGISATITNFGARLVSLNVDDRDGNPVDIILGFDSITDYLNSDSNFGAIIGRYANRIGYGTFTLNDSVFNVERNLGEHHLHGGNKGFHNALWTPLQPNDSTLILSLLSPDGAAGFPGNLDVTVTYSISADTLSISYAATTDRPTVINLTNHSYFNLSGNPANNILDHIIAINASRYTPTDSLSLPDGSMATVDGTPLDFRTAKAIGADINSDSCFISSYDGFDHNYVLDSNANTPAAILCCPATGIVMTLFTEQPGLQFYTTNSMKAGTIGKHGVTLTEHSAVCLEPQHFPDSPNHPQFPSTRLDPGQTFTSVTKYCFSRDKR